MSDYGQKNWSHLTVLCLATAESVGALWTNNLLDARSLDQWTLFWCLVCSLVFYICCSILYTTRLPQMACRDRTGAKSKLFKYHRHIVQLYLDTRVAARRERRRGVGELGIDDQRAQPPASATKPPDHKLSVTGSSAWKCCLYVI